MKRKAQFEKKKKNYFSKYHTCQRRKFDKKGQDTVLLLCRIQYIVVIFRGRTQNPLVVASMKREEERNAEASFSPRC